MKKGRLEAFSDGVIAIIITIMVLELKVPHEHDLQSLLPVLPVLLSYVLSFVYVGIYWNNHHHMFYLVDTIAGSALWANLNLLFWLSLVPFVTEWMGESHFAQWPVAAYGFVLIMNSISYGILARVLIRHSGKSSALAEAVGRDRKGKISTLIYALAIGLSFVHAYLSFGLYIVVAIIWFIPDTRIEKKVVAHTHPQE
ncbi:MAG TPA: TMEM175 family protein [Mucilaginibacter sp.]|nr:TMEM175 family protein [Mucilaginibacter sp.]